MLKLKNTTTRKNTTFALIRYSTRLRYLSLTSLRTKENQSQRTFISKFGLRIMAQLKTGHIDKTTAYIALAIWRGDEYILSFLFANQLRFRQTNNAEQRNKQ